MAFKIGDRVRILSNIKANPVGFISEFVDDREADDSWVWVEFDTGDRDHYPQWALKPEKEFALAHCEMELEEIEQAQEVYSLLQALQ